jgi:hypothetical protein
MKFFCTLVTMLFVCCVFAQNRSGGIVEQILSGTGKKFNGTPCVAKGSFLTQLTIGTPNNVANKLNVNVGGLGIIGGIFGVTTTDNTSNKIGPITISGEYFTNDNVSVGGQVLYAAGKRSLTVGTTKVLDNTLISVVQLLGTTAYHFSVTDKLDPYLKAAVGYAIWQDKSGSSATTVPEAVSYSGVLGLRYFTNSNFAIVGEASFSNLNISGNIGVTLKL